MGDTENLLDVLYTGRERLTSGEIQRPAVTADRRRMMMRRRGRRDARRSAKTAATGAPVRRRRHRRPTLRCRRAEVTWRAVPHVQHYSEPVPGDPLVCEVAHTPPLAYVLVRGRLDPLTAAVLRQAVSKALTEEPEAVLVDLAGVTDVDPIALTVFVSLARAAAAWPGAQLVQHSAAPALARQLDELAINRHVPLAADRAAAEVLAGRGSGSVQVRVSWDVIGGADGLAGARDVVRVFCLRHGLDALSGNAELMVTELVVNAVVHGTAPITVWVSLRGRYLHLAVRDRSAVMPRLTGPDQVSGGGRGLMIVEALTVAWGATPTPDGKIVWCTLRR